MPTASTEPGLAALALVALAIGAGGAAGAVARLWVSDRLARAVGLDFPWGTLAVNLAGAFLIGALVGWRGLPAGQPAFDLWWAGLVIGLLGSFTTVSSFALQTLQLVQTGHRRRAASNVLATVGGGLVAGLAGLALGHLLGGGP